MQINYYLNDRQIAERYGVHRSTVWRWVKSGHFPAPRTIGENTKRWADTDVSAHEAKLDKNAQ